MESIIKLWRFFPEKEELTFADYLNAFVSSTGVKVFKGNDIRHYARDRLDKFNRSPKSKEYTPIFQPRLYSRLKPNPTVQQLYDSIQANSNSILTIPPTMPKTKKRTEDESVAMHP